MITKNIGVVIDAVENTYGCNNCSYDIDGRTDMCEDCMFVGFANIPSAYAPLPGNIQEKCYLSYFDKITEFDINKFYKSGI